ncbi:type II toxin-antitoxin system death-on-curing family toxin [Candidatus Nitrosocosmicus franklandus]|uniref:Fido domain-containing protein n=1 Tax=Candidatus Nitrosocosmicus franklandianus TaxID=1798806 RepID=A0A484IDC2_9ARCH|nr:type II toxin-antitoxin system death-on-curing family toxin [Candidatus Nitrosocosmicus franklandus]VFJ14047.1 conserved protein of unknown function [Candidatus Nitrosocosmicus franklandus]
MSEYFSSDEIDEIIQFNKKIVEEDGSSFEVDLNILCSIFDKVNTRYEKELDKKTRIIKKATRILAGITFNQPFYEGNKRTAIIVTLMFLNRNGFDIPLVQTEQKRKLYDLLMATMLKSRTDTTVYSEVEEYLKQELVIKE